jgi:zinc transport system permease protein
VRTLEYLTDPALREIYLFGMLAGLAVVIMCGPLSVFVVVKRLGFVGQGVSHSAFGGVGLAALLVAAGIVPQGGPWQLAIIVAFCVAAALGMAAISDRRTVPVDTAIGLFLVGSMAVGAILVHESLSIAERAGRTGLVQSWESILFGSIFGANERDAATGWSIAAVVLAAMFWFRRALVFWAIDEDSARAFGVQTRFIKTLLMVLLALAVVVAMQLAGVVLATALLVLPGAAALKLSSRLTVVTVLSIIIGVLGLVGGLVLSFELNWPPGPSVVLMLTAFFALAAAGRSLVPGPSASASLNAPSPS